MNTKSDDLHEIKMWVTPELAQEWLSLNVGNRGEKVANVTKYARDMKTGNWHYTAEPIKFAKSGRLLDGQNRLLACIEADTRFFTLVVFGLDDKAQAYMDSGAPRRTLDALAMLGYPNSAALSAAITTHMWWVYGVFKHAMHTPQGADRPTTQEAIEHIQEHPDLVEAVQWGGTIRSKTHLPIGSLATGIYELARIDSEETEDFFNRLANYQTTGAGDPMSTMLRRLAIARERREAIIPATGLFLIFRTWNAIQRGETLARMPIGSETKGWAKIPEPVHRRKGEM